MLVWSLLRFPTYGSGKVGEKLGLKGNTLGAFRPLNDADVAAILRIAAS